LRISSSLRPVEENHCAGAGTGMIACIASGIAQMKRRHSSAQVPISMSTFAALPAATSSAAVLARVTPSTTGRSTIAMLRSSPSSPGSRASTAACSPRRTAGRNRAGPPIAGLDLEQLEHRCARVAVSDLMLWLPAPIGGSRAKSPFALGVPMSVPTLMPPADSPKIVTLLGSPPNAAMLSRTHSSAPVEDAEVAGALRASNSSSRYRTRARAGDS
jgi:hypothetical protein